MEVRVLDAYHTTKLLNLLLTGAEQRDRTRNFRVYIGSGSDGSSTDMLSLDLMVNPWDTAITQRCELHSMSKIVCAQYDPSGSWRTELSDVWLDDVQMFHHRPIRCVAIVHPYFPAQRDPDLLAEYAHLSCAKMCIDVSSFSPDLHGDKHATSKRRQKNEISNSETFVIEFVDQHHFIRSNNYVHDEFRFWHGEENRTILF